MNYMNLEENQGFLRSVFALTVLICYTWRFHQDVSWMLYHRKTQNSQNCLKIVSKLSKFVLNFKIRVYFQFMGLGQFSECGLVYCLLWLRNDINFITIYTISTINWPHHPVCASRVFPDWESGVSSLVACAMGLSTVPVCQPCQKCASMPEGHPWSVVLPWMFPGGSSCPRCPEGQDIVPLCQMAQNPQDCTYGSDLFVMMILVCFTLSCDGLLAVFVTINC